MVELAEPTYVHFDSAGRQDLFNFNPVKQAIYSENAVNLEEGIFFPFRFADPINRTSLKAAEILTSLNEIHSTKSEVLDNYKYGFMFDNIVALTYRIEDFVLSPYVRTSFDGEDCSPPPDLNITGAGWFGNSINFSYKFSLPYIDPSSGRVKANTLYPLTIRARIKKVDNDEY